MYLARQNVPSAVTLTLGNKVVLRALVCVYATVRARTRVCVCAHTGACVCARAKKGEGGRGWRASSFTFLALLIDRPRLDT